MNDIPGKDSPGKDSGAPQPSLALDPATAAPAGTSAYRVLARKYRPIRFEDLIGQEPMVRTIANSFASGRIHQAYILSGVRGVGKTTTARILARAFNYSTPGGIDAPSVELPTLGVHCQAIIESRHIDVIEMDAASHTGIDDVREIIENARYRPVSARYKVYIIDEVHMLSKQAFNGLLKTLEEPPEHVKFIFATTEIEKVPITVRSRCLRFDLKRIDAQALARHMERICAAEEVVAEPEALSLIARLAEGSARDALSLLDQAIAYDAGREVKAASLRAMLGLADRGAIVDLFELTMKGEIAAAMRAMETLYRAGADPAQMLVELAEFTHYVTRLKIAQEKDEDPTIGAEARARASALAEGLGLAPLTRAWQILLKGLQEIKDSPRPLASAEMALIRLAYAADMPSPEEALRKLKETPASPSVALEGPRAAPGAPSALRQIEPTPTPAPAPAPAATPTLASFADVVALAKAKRDIKLQTALERDVRLERFERGKISFSLVEGASSLLPQTLAGRLQEWTGERWIVALAPGSTTPTVRETVEAKEKERLRGVAAHPLVRQILESFPGAEIVEVRGGEPPPVPSLTDEEIEYGDARASGDDM